MSSVKWKRKLACTGFPCLCGVGAAAPHCANLAKGVRIQVVPVQDEGFASQLPSPWQAYAGGCIWALFKVVDSPTGRVESSWEYFTVFAQPCNAIFSVQCCTHLISFPWFLNLFYFDGSRKACGCLFFLFSPSFTLLVFALELCKPDFSLHWIFNMVWAFSIMSSW